MPPPRRVSSAPSTRQQEFPAGGVGGNLYLRNVTLRKKGMHAKKQLTITWRLIGDLLCLLLMRSNYEHMRDV